MINNQPAYFSLGESAMVVQWGNTIDRQISIQVNKLASQLKNYPLAGITNIVPAYCSLSVFFDVIEIKKQMGAGGSIFNHVKKHLEKLMQANSVYIENVKTVIEIPVCYDGSLTNDLSEISRAARLTIPAIIQRHTAPEYYVYMQGFLPGFAYMGEVDEQIALPRKNNPVNVTAGAVGIAGRQTGIYPVNSPGGWQIVGHTPWQMFDAGAENPCLVMAGDYVKFIPVELAEYHAIKNNKTA